MRQWQFGRSAQIMPSSGPHKRGKITVLKVPPQFLTWCRRQGGCIHTCWPDRVSMLQILVQKSFCCCSTWCLPCCGSLMTNDGKKKSLLWNLNKNKVEETKNLLTYCFDSHFYSLTNHNLPFLMLRLARLCWNVSSLFLVVNVSWLGRRRCHRLVLWSCWLIWRCWKVRFWRAGRGALASLSGWCGKRDPMHLEEIPELNH